MTKCIKRIRDLFEYALYKFTLYLLTYLQLLKSCWSAVSILLCIDTMYEGRAISK